MSNAMKTLLTKQLFNYNEKEKRGLIKILPKEGLKNDKEDLC